MDDLQAKLAVNLLTEIFKEAVKGVHALVHLVADKSRGTDPLGTAAQTYVESALRRHTTMRIFGMSRSIPLDRIYTTVKVLDERYRSATSSPERLSRSHDSVRVTRFGTRQPTKPGLVAVDEFEKLMLLGKPGSGKTTFLKHVLMQALRGKLSKSYVPLFVSLHETSVLGRTIMEALINEFTLAGIHSPKEFLERLLDSGRCVLLFDGLDEVSEANSYSTISEIKDISDRYFKNKFIVSCRVAVYNYWLPQFSDVEIADFDEPEITVFVKNWFSDEGDRIGTAFATQINAQSQIKELASTPLFLTMLCLALEKGIELSKNGVELYDGAIDALLQTWDGSRRIRRDDRYKHMTVHRKRGLLSFIAAVSFEKGEYFFSKRRLTEMVVDYIQNLPEVDLAHLTEEAHGIIEAIVAHHGLLVPRGREIYSFSHLTFQEFFAANYVKDRPESQSHLIEEHLGDPRWREVIVAVGCLLSEADEYVMRALKEMVSAGSEARYIEILESYLKQTEGKRTESASSRRPFFWAGARANLGSAVSNVKARRITLAERALNPAFQRVGTAFVDPAGRGLTEMPTETAIKERVALRAKEQPIPEGEAEALAAGELWPPHSIVPLKWRTELTRVLEPLVKRDGREVRKRPDEDANHYIAWVLKLAREACRHLQISWIDEEAEQSIAGRDLLSSLVRRGGWPPYEVLPIAWRAQLSTVIPPLLKDGAHARVYERQEDYVKAVVTVLRKACGDLRVTWTKEIEEFLSDQLEEKLVQAMRKTAGQVQQEFRSISMAEAMLDLLRSPAYMSLASRETAIRTIEAGRVRQ